MDAVLKIVQTVNMYLSDYILIIMLIGCGLYFSFKTKFVQVRCFGEGWRKVFGNFSLHGGKHEGGMSSFQALATAIAAQVGTGNIVGACGAILVGGPGAIFWMWIIAFFGMSTIYAEAVLAQKTRVVNPDGTVAGGPVYYIKKAFNNAFGKVHGRLLRSRYHPRARLHGRNGSVQLHRRELPERIRHPVMGHGCNNCCYLRVYLHRRCSPRCCGCREARAHHG